MDAEVREAEFRRVGVEAINQVIFSDFFWWKNIRPMSACEVAHGDTWHTFHIWANQEAVLWVVERRAPQQDGCPARRVLSETGPRLHTSSQPLSSSSSLCVANLARHVYHALVPRPRTLFPLLTE